MKVKKLIIKPKTLYAIVNKKDPEISYKEIYSKDQTKGIYLGKDDIVIKVKVIYEQKA